MADSSSDEDALGVINNDVTEEGDTRKATDENGKTVEEEACSDTWVVNESEENKTEKEEIDEEACTAGAADQSKTTEEREESDDTSKELVNEGKTADTEKEASDAASPTDSNEEVKSKNEEAVSTEPAILMSGNLLRQGTINPSWRKSYFVLKDKKLLFVKTQDDDLAKPDGVADLTLGRGVRSKEECAKSVEWPNDVKEEQCFGVALEDGTYYLVGRDIDIVKKWKDELGKVIKEFSTKTSDNSDEDVEGMPESIPIKIVRGVAKVASKVLPFIAKSGIVDGEGAELLKDAGTAIEKQEEMGPNASVTDRFKAGASSAVGAGGKLADDQYVTVAADVVTQQLDADKNMSPQERAARMVGTASKGLAKTDLVGNNEAAKVALQTGSVVADMTSDQIAAGEDASLKQRGMRAVGVAAKGISTIGPVADNEIAKNVLKVGGDVLHSQGKADNDASMGERLAIGAASLAGGASEIVKNDDAAEAMLKATEESAKEVEKAMKKERKDKKKEEDKKKKEGKKQEKEDEDKKESSEAED